MAAFSYSHAGIGYPNGETPVSFWTGMPGVDRGFLILDSEHWHVDTILNNKPEALHVLRAMTGPLDNSARIAKRTLRHFEPWKNDERLALQFRNEDNLNYERGDSLNDWDWQVMESVYAKSAEMYVEIATYLRRDLGVRNQLVFPPYAPGHYLQEMADLWVPFAKYRTSDDKPLFPKIGMHQYGEPEAVLGEVEWFQETFPASEGYEVLLLEWHGDKWFNEEGSWQNTYRQELQTLEGLAKRKVKAYFFIGKWVPPAESWSSEWDIQGNQDRTTLFRNPPLHSPIEEPMPQEPTYLDIFKAIEEVCADLNCPRIPAYALAEAESGLIGNWELGKPPSVIRPASESQYASYWPDVSGGPFHQTVRWAVEYTSTGGGSTFPGVTKCREVLNKYRYDARHATSVALRQLRGFLAARAAEKGVDIAALTFEDVSWALYRYNKPNGEPSESIKKRYRDSLTKAHAFVKALDEGEDVMPEFRFGFKALADALGTGVVGEPLTDEEYVNEKYSVQYTTTGKMEYSKDANKAYFFVAAHPD